MNNKELLTKWQKSIGSEEKFQKRYGVFAEDVLKYAKTLSDMPFEMNPQVFENLRKVKISYKKGDENFGGFIENFRTDASEHTPSENGIQSAFSIKVYVKNGAEENAGYNCEINEVENAKLTLFHELNHAVCYKEYYLSDQYGDDTKMKVSNSRQIGGESDGATPKEMQDAGLLANGYMEEHINGMTQHYKSLDDDGNLVSGSLKTHNDILALHEGITELLAVKVFLKNYPQHAKDSNRFIEKNAQYLPFVRLVQVYNLVYNDILTKTYFSEPNEEQKLIISKIKKDFCAFYENYNKMINKVENLCNCGMDEEWLENCLSSYKENMKKWQQNILSIAKSQVNNNAMGSERMTEILKTTNLLTKMDTYRGEINKQGKDMVEKEILNSIIKSCDKKDADADKTKRLEKSE